DPRCRLFACLRRSRAMIDPRAIGFAIVRASSRSRFHAKGAATTRMVLDEHCRLPAGLVVGLALTFDGGNAMGAPGTNPSPVERPGDQCRSAKGKKRIAAKQIDEKREGNAHRPNKVGDR